MARIQGNAESGKLGNKILYTWHGRQCERSMPVHVANPRTEAQQAHRSRFAQIAKLASYMKEAHLVGLQWQAAREQNSTYALFKHLNKDCFTSEGEIDYPRIVVSKGATPKVAISTTTIDADGVLSVAFDRLGGAASDQLILFVYCPALCTGLCSSPIPRNVNAVSAELPADWAEQTLHLYAFVRSSRGRTSGTIYREVKR